LGITLTRHNWVPPLYQTAGLCDEERDTSGTAAGERPTRNC
jgi:hypothetical protein